MSQHPEVEKELMAELDRLQLSITPQRRHPRKMTYADLNRLIYLQATIKVATAHAWRIKRGRRISDPECIQKPETARLRHAMHQQPTPQYPVCIAGASWRKTFAAVICLIG